MATQTTTSTDAQPPKRRPFGLFKAREKVYPKAVSGTFRRIKWIVLTVLLAIYWITPWLRWDRGANLPDQGMLIDLPGRRAYFFFFEIWPEEVYVVTGILVLMAVGLFFFTSMVGRVWCGYACPQTVWTDLYMWVERKIEGDRSARIRRDKRGFSFDALWRKTAKHLVWLAIAFLTGGAFVLYFNDAPTVVSQIVTLEASKNVWFAVLFLTGSTYLLAGHAREQVCTYMCPYARFQSAMLDEDSLIVTYRPANGEPRGKYRKGESFDERGGCIDCNQCVQVCPTGIDIRDGLQMECISCGLCIDACANVMDKIGRPHDLIGYDTMRNLTRQAEGKPRQPTRILRPRTFVYAGFLALVGLVVLSTLIFRSEAEVNILRDRNPLFVQLSTGDIRNGYTFKVENRTHETKDYLLAIDGLPRITMSVVGDAELTPAGEVSFTAEPNKVASFHVYAAAPREVLVGKSTPITFVLIDQETSALIEHDSVFMGPEK